MTNDQSRHPGCGAVLALSLALILSSSGCTNLGPGAATDQTSGNGADQTVVDPVPGSGAQLPGTGVLTIDISGQGHVLEAYNEGSVTLTPIPDEGWVFEKWTGAAEGSDNPLVLTLDADTLVSAEFVRESALGDTPAEDPQDITAPDADGDGTPDAEDDCPDHAGKTAPGICGCDVPDADVDADGAVDCVDNCPALANADQADTDGDREGDACDSDDDGDGVFDRDDLCGATVLTTPVDARGCADTQVDQDGDGICDPDAPSVGPSVCVGVDNCPSTANPDQADSDGDGIGDACDADDDQDGVINDGDRCPATAAGAAVDASGCSDAQVDADGDGSCDADAAGSGPSGCSGSDNCRDAVNPDQIDTDSDGAGDACDDDDDGDGVPDGSDLCAATLLAESVDSLGCADAQVDPDGDGVCDPDAPSGGPGACVGVDNCPSTANPDQADSDGNGIGDACEPAVCGNGLIETGETCDPPCNECSLACQWQAPEDNVTWTAGTALQLPEAPAPTVALLGVWGSGPEDVFFVGGTIAQGAVFHFDGQTWSSMTVPEVGLLIWAFGFGPDNVYSVGEGGALIHYDGNDWSKIQTNRTESLWGIWGASPTDMWIVGGDAFAGDPLMIRFDGQTLTPTAVNLNEGETAHTLFKVWGIGSRLFAVGQKGLIVEYDGQSWNQVASGATQRFISLWGTSENNIVAVGGDFAGQVARFDGTDWTTTVDFSVSPINAVYMTHPDRAVIGGMNGYKGHYDMTNNSFTQEDPYPFPPIHALWSDCNGRFYGVGGFFAAPHMGFYLIRESSR